MMPMDKPRYCDVILPLALPQALTYVLPSRLAEQVGVGSRVVVPLGQRKWYAGIVMRLHSERPAEEYVLKEVVEVVDATPLVTEEQLTMWQWMADYYMCTPGEVMKAALPAGLKLESEMQVQRHAEFGEMESLLPRDAALLVQLPATRPMKVQVLQRLAGGGSVLPSVRRLVECGAVVVTEQIVRQFRPRTVRKACLARAAEADRHVLRQTLSPRQERALEEIRACFTERDCCLLHGVTSCGKTELYIRLIQECMDEGKQALYLLPEIALTTQIMQRLTRVFGDRMGVYHSRFPDAERVELWKKQATDGAELVLGVRSALFLPYKHLGLIIVDEEHDPSYKQQDPAPRYNARDMALVLARITGAKVLLGTATPALETYHNARTGRYGLVELQERYGGVQMPEIIVEDVSELRRKKLMRGLFSPRLEEEIRQSLSKREQVILFQNRRGYSPVLECRSCGWTPRCTRCDVPLTFHQRDGRLVCHYCGANYAVPSNCPNCDDTELRDLGYGTEKVETAVRAAFPEARTARLDLDTTRARAAYDTILGDFSAGRTDILIGTQMVTKGLDFDRVRVVGILNADQMLNKPDFRAYERAFQLMSQVAGRAGRRAGRGLVVVQTSQPSLSVTEHVVHGDYARLYAELLEERRDFCYPPFTRVIYIYVKHRDEHVCAAAAQHLTKLLLPHFGTEALLGPDRPAVARVHLQYIRRLLLKVSPALPVQGVRRTLLAARTATLAMTDFRTVNIYFDVDPA